MIAISQSCCGEMVACDPRMTQSLGWAVSPPPPADRSTTESGEAKVKWYENSWLLRKERY